MNSKHIAPLIVAALLFSSCHNSDYTPLPQAYLRIDMPQPSYRLCDTADFPFSFEVSRYASVCPKKHSPRDVWFDIVYPQWDAFIFLSYKHLSRPDDLRGQTDTSLRLLESHYQFASGIDEQGYSDTDNKVFANVCRLNGSKVASTCQFWATDSNRHFLRGALYLDHTPNNDSLAPILHFVQADIDRLVESLRWRN